MNLVSKRPYQGINTMLLAMYGYEDNRFLSLFQINQLGLKLKAKAKSHIVVFWKWLEKNIIDGGEEKIKKTPLLRYYLVFNISQLEIIPEEYLIKNELVAETITPCEEADMIITDMPLLPHFIQQGNEAYYTPSTDTITLPPMEKFINTEFYYSTIFHELIHCTGHSKRLNRKGVMEKNKFGSMEYSFEELVAEIGASYLCSLTGLEQEDFSNNASYIAGWLKKLQNDKKFIVQASVSSQKAVDYILNVSNENNTSDIAVSSQNVVIA